MVKVISFCLWGDQKKYTIGAIKNVDLAKVFYPDFECWIYVHEPSVPKYIVDELFLKDNVKIIFKYSDINTSKPMMWRFEPIINKDVELFMSRDTDTRILLREQLAVNEWINSDKLIHIMRDHPYHDYCIQGGMWGMKQNNLCDFEQLFEQVKQTSARLYDQLFVSNVLYPLYKNSSMIHASHHKFEQDSKEFPISFCNEKKFVGEYVYEDESRVPEHYNMIKL